METSTMIRQLRALSKKHKNDRVNTFGTDWSLLCNDVAKRLEELNNFKKYFMELYGEGLEVANWHLNGDLEPLDNFIDSAIESEEE